MSEKVDLIILNVLPELGKLNALVKNLMKATGIEDPNEVIRSINNQEWILTPIAKAVGEYLESLGKVTFEIDQSINPDEFLQTREGLWVDSDLENWLGGTAEKITGNIESSKWKIKKDSFDKEIKSEIPSDHIYVVGEFRTIIASAIHKQWGGKAGVLRNDGYANIFYVWNKDKTKCFAVGVLWAAGYEEWRVSVCELEDRWRADGVVFSRN